MLERRIHVLEMGKHFLYLPLYFAADQNFFGYLPTDVHVEISPCEDHTDKTTYLLMMSGESEHRDIVVAVTDPVQILQTPLTAKCKPAVLCALVTNAAFWAINHGTHKIKAFRDLGAFDKVIAYAPGTTSYNIAARIARDSKKSVPLEQFIEVVPPGTELSRFSMLGRTDNAFALSPNVLNIERLTQEGEMNVELPLGVTPEYNDVLVTALITYDEYVVRNPEIVRGLVMGIQKALLMIRRESPEVIHFAKNHFYYAERAAGAIRMALDAGVFPPDVKVAKSHWKHAVKAFDEARHPDQPWSLAEEALAEDYFRDCIEPYAPVAESAIKLVPVSDEKANPPPKLGFLAYSEPIWLFLVAAASIAATRLIGTRGTVVLLGVSIVAWTVIKLLRHKHYFRFIFWASLILWIAVTPLPWIFSELHEKLDLFVATGIGFLLASWTAGMEYAKSTKE